MTLGAKFLALTAERRALVFKGGTSLSKVFGTGVCRR
jgi:predicted nucleotidyltransferase component of viral defense system